MIVDALECSVVYEDPFHVAMLPDILVHRAIASEIVFAVLGPVVEAGLSVMPPRTAHTLRPNMLSLRHDALHLTGVVYSNVRAFTIVGTRV